MWVASGRKQGNSHGAREAAAEREMVTGAFQAALTVGLCRVRPRTQELRQRTSALTEIVRPPRIAPPACLWCQWGCTSARRGRIRPSDFRSVLFRCASPAHAFEPLVTKAASLSPAFRPPRHLCTANGGTFPLGAVLPEGHTGCEHCVCQGGGGGKKDELRPSPRCRTARCRRRQWPGPVLGVGDWLGSVGCLSPLGRKPALKDSASLFSKRDAK